VRNALLFLVGTCLIGLSAGAWAVAQQSPPNPVTPAIVDEMLLAVRADLQSSRADIIAKNVTLTSGQAAKFWPLFSTYQTEQNVIMDDQLKGLQRYIDGFDSLDDSGALGLINAHFERDARMNALRKKWLDEFNKVLGAKLAVRVMQIDRRLSLAHQLEFATRIPLSH
jgi:hypothetical protein